MKEAAATNVQGAGKENYRRGKIRELCARKVERVPPIPM